MLCRTHTGLPQPYLQATTLHQGQVPCLLKIYDAVARSGNPNYVTCRISLPQQLNIHKWREKLHDYHDVMLCDFLEFGWPLNYTSPTWPHNCAKNHASADAYPDHVHHYIQTESTYQAILGPYAEPPFSFFHTSPLMTRPKKNSDKRRIIMDLSYPAGTSINSGIPQGEYQDLAYKLHYPTIDTFVEHILHMGQGCHLFKVDISRAFQNLKVCPLDYPLLSLTWNEMFYFDTYVPFGCRNGSFQCQSTTDAIAYVLRLDGIEITNYVDDIVSANSPGSTLDKFLQVRKLLAKLGLEEADNKLCPPSTCMEFVIVT